MNRLAERFSSLSRPQIGDLYPKMFRQDLSNGVMPIGGRTEKFKDFDAKFTGSDADIARSFLSLLKNRRNRGDKENICEIINRLAREVLYFGESYYQIVTGELAEDGFQKILLSVTRSRLFRFIFIYVQFVPKGDLEFYKSRLLWNWSANVWKFSLPREFDSPIVYWWRLYMLRLANDVAPRFFSQSIFKGFKSDLNLDDYDRKRARFLAKITKRYGWNRRDFSSDKTTEFYCLYRTMKTEIFQAKLRTHLIDQTNKLLLSQKIDAKIEISGLPDAAILQKTLEEICNGSRPYEDFTNSYFY